MICFLDRRESICPAGEQGSLSAFIKNRSPSFPVLFPDRFLPPAVLHLEHLRNMNVREKWKP